MEVDLNQLPQQSRPAEHYLHILRESQGNRYSQCTIDNHQSHARRFLQEVGVKSVYSRQDLLSFVDRMVEAGYRHQSIYTILRSVHSLLHANGIPWPLDKRDLYIGGAQGPPNTPMLTHDEIRQMIEGAKGARFPDMQITILSTLYGFRNRELAKIISNGLDGKVIDVQTAKRGRRRVHQIPAPLSKVLCFKGKCHQPEAAHKAFERIMKRYVRPPKPQEGWHSNRRSLVTGLLTNGCSETTVTAFMGWTKTETVFRYFHPEPTDIDERVFKVHPFYSMWLKAS